MPTSGHSATIYNVARRGQCSLNICAQAPAVYTGLCKIIYKEQNLCFGSMKTGQDDDDDDDYLKFM